MPSKPYSTDLTEAAWVLIAPLLPAARSGGRPRTTDLRAVLNAIFYLLRTGCQWRLLPREFPAWGTVYHYFRTWQNTGVWAGLHRTIYEQARKQSGRSECPSFVIMDGQSVKTTERGGVRGFDGHKRVKGRKRHILVDTLGLPIANRVGPRLVKIFQLHDSAGSVMMDSRHERQSLGSAAGLCNGTGQSGIATSERVPGGGESDPASPSATSIAADRSG